MSRTLRLVLAACAVATALSVRPILKASSSDDEAERLQNSIDVLRDLTINKEPDKAIPRRVLERADAVIVIPSLVKGGFIVGGKHGRGVMSVRESEKPDWSAPAFMTLNGGSIGWQIGVQSVDLVMLVMNRKGVDDLLSDKFTLGGSASVAAGPVGKSGDAQSDIKMSSEILTYSRNTGVFAGLTLEGSSLRGDKDANEAFYGRPLSVRSIVAPGGTSLKNFPVAKSWRDLLRELTIPSVPAGRR